MRALRVLQAVAFFLAAPAALITAIIALSARGGQSGGDDVFVNAVLFVLFVLVAVGIAAGAVESVRLARVRRLRAERPRRTNEKELAPAWYAAFERSREGQWFGPGNPIPSVKTVVLVAIGSLAVLSCAAILFAASSIIVSGQILSTLVATQSASALGADARRDIGGVAYRVTPDRSITPIEAGEALLTIASTRQRRAPSPIERRVSADYPIWTRAVPPDSLFPKAPSQLWTSAAILAAANGLSPAQRTFLQQAAAHPAREEFTRAASAPSADVYGALLKLPLTQPLTVSTFPIVNLIGVRDAAESHAARVALEVADKQAADAERHAREIIAVGAQLLDMPFVLHNRIGTLIINNGVSALEAVFVATGREREARLLLESIVRSSSNRRPVYVGMERYRRELRDTTLTRGTRLEALAPLLFRACADPRQMFFGADESYRRVVAYARDSLARYPSERTWVDIWEGVLTLGDVRAPADQRGLLLFMARKVDGVVGGRRFESCASMTRMFRVM